MMTGQCNVSTGYNALYMVDDQPLRHFNWSNSVSTWHQTGCQVILASSLSSGWISNQLKRRVHRSSKWLKPRVDSLDVHKPIDFYFRSNHVLGRPFSYYGWLVFNIIPVVLWLGHSKPTHHPLASTLHVDKSTGWLDLSTTLDQSTRWVNLPRLVNLTRDVFAIYIADQ